MSTVEQGLQSQIRNIEATYGRPIDEWIEIIRTSGLTRHGEIVAMLKTEYGLSHGAAHRVALVAMDALAPADVSSDPVTSLDAGDKGQLLLIHERRRKQFAMIKPAAKHVDLGLVLPGQPVDARRESAATFNALFTHRVRVRSVDEVDPELSSWIGEAYDAAG